MVRKTARSYSKVLPNTHLVAEEAARDIDLLAPDDNNLLAVEDLLRDNRSKSAQKMALAVYDDGGGGEGGHGASGWGVANKPKVKTRNLDDLRNRRTW